MLLYAMVFLREKVVIMYEKGTCIFDLMMGDTLYNWRGITIVE